ncbi:hypothetical protein R3W88_026836 [Solanum pinnatisectum]|uniref:Uncharacterized protein n=1 Tax=Solanum pinnatisectum TaxID=50273 RepID=A0AAV9LEF6_9SOLN|nr:hypothetical protein R3W88_026836 [Solanum pinnatisectum]
MLDPNTLHLNPKVSDMFNYYNPYRSCKSKNFITKIMFMDAVARLRFDQNGVELFSGKIGIFPFVVKEAAKRNSRNRVVETLETKPILSVTKDITRACLIEKVLPAIRSKCPISELNTPIFIQQDSARPHIDINDMEFNEATREDLGFFRAIQSLQYQKAPLTIDELINAVETSFNEMKGERLNHVFLTLQSCMIEVMKAKGGNNYKVPYMMKERLEREGNLPIQLSCDIDIVNEANTLLQV